MARILSSSSDGLKIWDASSGALLATLTPRAGHWDVEACAYSPSGERIVSAHADRILRIWDAQSGAELAALTGHTYPIAACAFSPDGRKVVSASWDETLKIWDAGSGIELATLAGHTDQVQACAYSPDGKRLSSIAVDGSLRIWDSDAKAQISCFLAPAGVKAMAFGNGGQAAVIGDELGSVYVLRLLNVVVEPPVVTLVRLYRAAERRWDESITVECNWCGRRFTPRSELVVAIRDLNEKRRSSFGNVVSRLLGRRFVDRPLLSDCPNCLRPLRFNPFIVDNRR